MSKSYQAGGTIYPARFVASPDSGGMANDYIVVQASVNTTPTVVGVSFPWDRFAPGTPFDGPASPASPTGPAGPCAVTGQEVGVIQTPEYGNIETGAAVQSGDLLTWDIYGRAITATIGTWYAGRANQTATAAGVRIEIELMPCAYFG